MAFFKFYIRYNIYYAFLLLQLFFDRKYYIICILFEMFFSIYIIVKNIYILNQSLFQTILSNAITPHLFDTPESLTVSRWPERSHPFTKPVEPSNT